MGNFYAILIDECFLFLCKALSFTSMVTKKKNISYIGLPEQFWNCAEVTITEPPEQQISSSIQNKHSKTIIGYYASWQWYDRQKLAAPTNMDFNKVTRVYVL